jgi:cysteine desulfuration protein SufE
MGESGGCADREGALISEVSETMSYPPKLSEIIALFSELSDAEKRETLIAYADQARSQEPKDGETFDLEDIRKDEECTDTVAVFLRLDEQGGAHFRVTLGPQVQTLTKAMSSILCKGLDGITLEEVLEIPADFVPKIVGAELVRARSQTVYYLLTRMKGVAKVWLQRCRSASAGDHASEI